MRLFRFFCIGVIVSTIFLAALFSPGLGEENKAAPPKSKRPPLLVTTIKVEKGSIRAMAEFVGTTYFARVSEVAADIEGLVTRINFAEGDAVKKGDQLVQLDSQLLEAEITAARAESEQNLVDLENALVGPPGTCHCPGGLTAGRQFEQAVTCAWFYSRSPRGFWGIKAGMLLHENHCSLKIPGKGGCV